MNFQSQSLFWFLRCFRAVPDAWASPRPDRVTLELDQPAASNNEPPIPTPPIEYNPNEIFIPAQVVRSQVIQSSLLSIETIEEEIALNQSIPPTALPETAIDHDFQPLSETVPQEDSLLKPLSSTTWNNNLIPTIKHTRK